MPHFDWSLSVEWPNARLYQSFGFQFFTSNQFGSVNRSKLWELSFSSWLTSRLNEKLSFEFLDLASGLQTALNCFRAKGVSRFSLWCCLLHSVHTACVIEDEQLEDFGRKHTHIRSLMSWPTPLKASNKGVLSSYYLEILDLWRIGELDARKIRKRCEGDAKEMRRRCGEDAKAPQH